MLPQSIPTSSPADERLHMCRLYTERTCAVRLCREESRKIDGTMINDTTITQIGRRFCIVRINFISHVDSVLTSALKNSLNFM
jgi:hypothetical protein